MRYLVSFNTFLVWISKYPALSDTFGPRVKAHPKFKDYSFSRFVWRWWIAKPSSQLLYSFINIDRFGLNTSEGPRKHRFEREIIFYKEYTVRSPSVYHFNERKTFKGKPFHRSLFKALPHTENCSELSNTLKSFQSSCTDISFLNYFEDRDISGLFYIISFRRAFKSNLFIEGLLKLFNTQKGVRNSSMF